MNSINLKDLVVGVDQTVTIAGGWEVVYANLDNAASTPALKMVKKEADLLLNWYASIHRGAGYKSQVASEWYEQSRDEIMVSLMPIEIIIVPYSPAIRLML
ncbi:MAG: hypothetical protein P9L92_00310 [Candidatus Electryonea clarkiae]|nr:hypothetical protein [Candidatus Electryonea clarkiae]MDP8288874.1 hypothetical protein [Candidatus Electryonea clarkiae]